MRAYTEVRRSWALPRVARLVWGVAPAWLGYSIGSESPVRSRVQRVAVLVKKSNRAEKSQLRRAEQAAPARALGLPEELIMMLLNEDSGYFHQVPGLSLNCAVAGAVLAELSFLSRIDTDMERLILVDRTETGDPLLDEALEKIADEDTQRGAQYWVERLASRAEAMIEAILDRLVRLGILKHHSGDFWSLAHTARHTDTYPSIGEEESALAGESTEVEYIKARISKVIFDGDIPSPRDAVIIALVNTCDVFRFIFELEDEHKEYIQLVSRIDTIARAISEAVVRNISRPQLQRASLTKSIPVVPVRKLIFNQHRRQGNLPALFADLAREHGPVFEIRPPFYKRSMIFIAGLDMNRWVHRHGRVFLRSKDYFEDFEKVYGARGLIPGLDGADHFRLRKALRPGYSPKRLEARLDEMYSRIREHMQPWEAGDAFPAVRLCRRLANSQVSPLLVGVDSLDLMDDLSKYKQRVLNVHIAKIMPEFMLRTPGMRRRAASIDAMLDRVQSGRTAAQRAGCPRDLADDLLSLHSSDPQFLPESNLRFLFTAPVIASMYVGDQLSFVLYAMLSQPELHERIRGEADALFADGDPGPDDLNSPAIDVTRRFIMECLRVYPILPLSMRTVMNACVVAGCELPIGSMVHIVQTATHYLEEVFPDPLSFDIDRYLPERGEHLTPGYAPYGLGTHSCLGFQLVELQIAISLLMLTHYFELEAVPAGYKLKISPFPSARPNSRLKIAIAAQRRELPV